MKAIKFFIILIITAILVGLEVISFLGVTKETVYICCFLLVVGTADVALIIGLSKFDKWFDSNIK